MPLPNWDAVRQSLVSAIKAALPLQVARAGNDRIAGVGLHMDAYYGSADGILLGECVQAYLPLDEDQQREYQKLIGTERFAGVKAMSETIWERGIKEGIKEGLEKGRAEQRILERQA